MVVATGEKRVIIENRLQTLSISEAFIMRFRWCIIPFYKALIVPPVHTNNRFKMMALELVKSALL